MDLSQFSPEAQTRIAREILALKTVPRAWEEQAYYKQLPPDHPRHPLPDPVTGLACGCAGDPHWKTWLLMTGRGCVAGDTRIYLPGEGRSERIDVLASAGEPVTILSLTGSGPRPVKTDGAPFLKGVADLYKVTTDDGQVITVTGRHRFLTPQGWQRLAHMRAGQLLASGAPVPPDADSSRSGSRRGEQRSSDSESVSQTTEYSDLLNSDACLDAITWTAVVSITPAGTDVFYDMNVPEWENYAAEGFWVHNSGKTLTGANWAIQMALSEPGIWVGVCAPTFIDIKRVCFEGPSGIEKIAQPGEIKEYNKNGLRFTMRNGSVIQGYTADRPDSIRGANLAYCWFDELGSIRAPDFYHFGLLPALRISKGRMLITTTPRNVGIIADLVKAAQNPERHVHFTRATSMENWKSEGVLRMVEEIKAQYGLQSFIGRQELLGELIDDLPGQLFRIQDIDRYRVDEFPSLRRTIVAVDPASSANMRSDETGIVVVGEGEDRHYYTLQDVSMQATTDKVMSAIVGAFYRWEADLVVVEKNVAGDWFRQALYDKDPHVSYKPVQAMKGKLIRAQPLSPLMERGFFHMVGREFDELERQLTAMTAYDDRVKQHDDRADAWVWGMRELSGMGNVDWGEIYGFRTCLACGHRVNIRLEKTCRICGAPVMADPEPKKENTTRSVRWSNAYQKTCEQGHEYPMRLPRCPKCHDDQEYLARVSGWVNPSRGSRSVYTGRDPLSRRSHV